MATKPKVTADIRSGYDAKLVGENQRAEVYPVGRSHFAIRTVKGTATISSSTRAVPKPEREFIITLLKAIGLLLNPAICGLYVWAQMAPYLK